MKRAWIIPVVICLLLLAAWPFRWEKGPVQSDSKAKIAHMRDRWTGQAWCAYYGDVNSISLGHQFFSGEMVPYPSQFDIAKRKEQILASPEEVQKKQELEEKIDKSKKEMALHEDGHKKYYWLVSQEDKRQNPTRLFSFPLSDDVRYEKYEKGIPPEIIQEQESWIDAYWTKKQSESALGALPKQAEDTARSELMCWAWQKRNMATGIWVGLVVLSAIMAVILFIRASRSRHDQGVSTL